MRNAPTPARRGLRAAAVVASALLATCTNPQRADPPTNEYDLVVRNGLVYDGSGGPPRRTDIGVQGDRIKALGDLAGARAARSIDAGGMAIAPGFVNVLSWATESLIVDGRSLSDLRQGVTLEVMGEGFSMGPLSEPMRKELVARQGDLRYDVPWTTLGEYLEHLETRGVATNVASFVGAASVREYVLGQDNRAPNEAELARMQELVRAAMQEGALGVASALIYTPGTFASTEELIALCRAAQPYGGMYISHLRSEADRLLEGVDELLRIAREAGVRAEVYHLKAAGEANWPKLDAAIAKIEKARAEGLAITANMYLYTAGATGLDAAMPPWVREGGYEAWRARLRDPALRARVAAEMRTPSAEWESLLLAAGSADKVLLVGFKNEALKPYTGRTLADVARARGTSVEECAMDLVVEDGTRVEAVYFLMSEENVRKQVRLPWVSFCSDEASMAPEGAFLRSNPHPRAYGNFARLLGRYVGDEKLIPLEEAIRRLSRFPADTLRLRDRCRIEIGAFADLVVFSPGEIRDHATFERPHQLATGVRDVVVNGVPVLLDCEHTRAMPGRVVRGPGYRAQLPK